MRPLPGPIHSIIIFFFFFLGYTVRILGNAIKLAQLEIQTMMLLDPFPPITNATAMATLRNDSDPSKSKKCQYEPVFMQLADENK